MARKTRNRNWHSAAIAALPAVLALPLWSCGTGTAPHPAAPAVQQDSTGPSQEQALPSPPVFPAFPGADAPVSVMRTPSDSETVVPGNAFTEEQGEENEPGPSGPEAYIIAPGAEDDLAWALYGIGGFDPDRPTEISIELNSAPLVPGGDDPLPLSFFVGLSNYTQNSWEWFGPFDESQNLILNSPAVLERYIGPAGVFYFTLATLRGDEWITPENPDGLTACQITLSTVTTEEAGSENYNATKPLFEPIVGHSPSKVPSKSASALEPWQYVEIDWSHEDDLECPEASTTSYEVFRMGVEDAQPVLIGTVAAPEDKYIDPEDNDPSVPEPIPGRTYQYFLRAVNDQGRSSFDSVTETLPSNDWIHTWGTADSDIGNAIAYDVDGEIYVTGFGHDDLTDSNNFLLMYYAADGTQLNRHLIGGLADEIAYDITVDADGDKYIAGFSLFDFGNPSLNVLKFTESNNKEWDKIWTASNAIAYGIACDSVTGETYVTGKIQEGISNTVMLWLDGNGDIVTTPLAWGGRWTDSVNAKSSYGYDIALGAGGIFICGYYSSDANGDEALVMKVNADRTLAWAKSWGTAESEFAIALAVDPDNGSVYFTGYHSDDQTMVVKLNPDGSVAWAKSWIVPGKTSQGNSIMLAGTEVYVAGDLGGDVFLIGLDQLTGALELQETWGTPGATETLNSIAYAADLGSLIGAGTALNATGETGEPAGVVQDVTDAASADLLFSYDGGINTMNDAGYTVVTPDGTEDTGGGNADALVVRSQL